MPIHFSVGFVVEQRPRRQIESVCAKTTITDSVDAVVKDVEYINVCWQTSVRGCN